MVTMRCTNCGYRLGDFKSADCTIKCHRCKTMNSINLVDNYTYTPKPNNIKVVNGQSRAGLYRSHTAIKTA